VAAAPAANGLAERTSNGLLAAANGLGAAANGFGAGAVTGRRCSHGFGTGGVGALEHDVRLPDLDLVADVQLALVDSRAIDHRARLVTEVDQRDVLGAGDLDDGVHP